MYPFIRRICNTAVLPQYLLNQHHQDRHHRGINHLLFRQHKHHLHRHLCLSDDHHLLPRLLPSAATAIPSLLFYQPCPLFFACNFLFFFNNNMATFTSKTSWAPFLRVRVNAHASWHYRSAMPLYNHICHDFYSHHYDRQQCHRR